MDCPCGRQFSSQNAQNQSRKTSWSVCGVWELAGGHVMDCILKRFKSLLQVQMHFSPNQSELEGFWTMQETIIKMLLAGQPQKIFSDLSHK